MPLYVQPLRNLYLPISSRWEEGGISHSRLCLYDTKRDFANGKLLFIHIPNFFYFYRAKTNSFSIPIPPLPPFFGADPIIVGL